MAVDWKFILANTSDLSKISELSQARGRSLDVALNSPGSLRFNYPITDEWASSIVPAATCIIAIRNDTTVWSGPVWIADDDVVSGFVDVSAVGWFTLLTKRYIEKEISYTSLDAGTIAQNLLTIANAQRATGIVNGFSEASQTRTRSYQRSANVGNEIKALSDIEAGYDYVVDPATRALNIYAKKQNDLRTTVHFGYRRGPDNVSAFKRSIDASVMANRVIAVGQYGSYQADDFADQATYGLFSDRVQLSDVPDLNVLAAYAGTDIIFRSAPRVTYTVTPMPSGPDNVPQPFRDYDVGDLMELSAKRGTRVDVNAQAVRLFAFSVNIGDNGSEQVTNMRFTAS